MADDPTTAAQAAPQAEGDPVVQDGSAPEAELTPTQRIEQLTDENAAMRALLSRFVAEDVDLDTELSENVLINRAGEYIYNGELGLEQAAPEPEADPDPEPAPEPPKNVRQRMQSTPRRAPIAQRQAATPAAEPDIDAMSHEERAKYWQEVVKPQTVRIN